MKVRTPPSGTSKGKGFLFLGVCASNFFQLFVISVRKLVVDFNIFEMQDDGGDREGKDRMICNCYGYTKRGRSYTRVLDQREILVEGSKLKPHDMFGSFPPSFKPKQRK